MYENKQNTLLIPFMKIFELKTTRYSPFFFIVSFTVSSLLKFESKTPEGQSTKIYTGRSNKLPFYIPFLKEKVPLNSYTVH